MTQDELLARIDGFIPIAINCNLPFLIPSFNALRAVVELHKERSVAVCDDMDCCGVEYICKDCKQDYPCPTIQAIEKELG